ncbi:hypothetical protein ARMSODRAFT_947341 [Armillaria solidipes]|uniref:Uncharacterized protein n=1 Tax=Armillaria solidipes TaxID=1076256 RepID=A0A2H3CGV7_9AGAR|nr:hypothetical protein ARMSODRAFT_947341 [Armillaria solidipes]
MVFSGPTLPLVYASSIESDVHGVCSFTVDSPRKFPCLFAVFLRANGQYSSVSPSLTVTLSSSRRRSNNLPSKTHHSFSKAITELTKRELVVLVTPFSPVFRHSCMVAEGRRGPIDHDDNAMSSKTSPTARLCPTVSLMSSAANLTLHDLDLHTGVEC